MCQLEKTKRGFDVAAAAKNQIQSELGEVSHQILKKNISKK